MGSGTKDILFDLYIPLQVFTSLTLAIFIVNRINKCKSKKDYVAFAVFVLAFFGIWIGFSVYFEKVLEGVDKPINVEHKSDRMSAMIFGIAFNIAIFLTLVFEYIIDDSLLVIVLVLLFGGLSTVLCIALLIYFQTQLSIL